MTGLKYSSLFLRKFYFAKPSSLKDDPKWKEISSQKTPRSKLVPTIPVNCQISFEKLSKFNIKMTNFWMTSTNCQKCVNWFTVFSRLKIITSDVRKTGAIKYTPLNQSKHNSSAVMGVLGGFQGVSPQLGAHDCRETPASRTAVRLVAVVFPVRNSTQ